MRVAQIMYSGLGGHGSVAFSLIEADKKNQWNTYIGFIGIEPLLSTYVNFCKKNRIRYEYFPIFPGKSWKKWFSIVKWLKSINPEVIICHSSAALIPCFLYSRIRKVKIIYVEHQPNHLKTKIDWINSFIAFLTSNFVVSLTPQYLSELYAKRCLLINRRKAKIIANGINTDMFYCLERELNLKKVIHIGMAGRFSPTKKQDVLIKMVAKLTNEYPDFTFHLSLAGDGEQAHRLHSIVRELDLIENIEFTGYLGEIQLIEWFTKLDIYVHATEGETLSTSILQAMASGLPIIASDVPGVNNLLNEIELKDYLIETNTPQKFSSAIMSLIYNYDSVKPITKNRRRKIEIEYSNQKMFERYSSLINSTP
jgi:glycosyltransferase involved in cell wall biosynthesis